VVAGGFRAPDVSDAWSEKCMENAAKDSYFALEVADLLSAGASM
jgi:hypothetical protein